MRQAQRVDLGRAMGLVITGEDRCVCVCVRALLLITACSPFSCLADPRGMLFPWQCQVVSLHYSWPCSPAPVQGLSPCSNAIFITHTHIQTVAVREGLMVMLSP